MLKIFLLTKNETFFIEDWIKYHGYLFNFSNIHILDGSDDKEVLDIYKKFIPLGLNVHYSDAGLNEACQEINRLMNDYKGSNNFLIKLDTDEFLAYTEPFHLGPHNFSDRFLQKGYLARPEKTTFFRRLLSQKIMDLRHADKTLLVKNFNEHLDRLPITGQRYKASLTVWSLPTTVTNHRPCRNLTRFTPIQFTHLKSFFHSSSFVSVDLGSHRGVSTQNDGVIETGLTIVHYHSTSVEDTMTRAKQALLSHGYFDASDDLKKQRDKLTELKNLGKIASSHKIELYLRYIDSLEGGEPVSPATLNEYHKHFRPTNATREISIIKDTLEQIDSLCLYAGTS